MCNPRISHPKKRSQTQNPYLIWVELWRLLLLENDSVLLELNKTSESIRRGTKSNLIGVNIT